MPQFAPFDLARAQSAGTQNALAQMQAMQVAQQIQQAPEERNYLMQQREAQSQSQELDKQIKGFTVLKNAATQVLGAKGAGYDQFKIKMEELGVANEGELPDVYDENIIKGLSGYATKQLEQFGPMEQIPGAPEGTFGQKSTTTGKYAAIQKPSKPLVEIKGAVAEKEEQKAWGKSLVKHFDDIYEQGQAAGNSMEALTIAGAIDVKSGAFEPVKNWAAGAVAGLGFDPEKVGLDKADNAQAFQGIVENLVLTKMQAQKGPQTENDAKRIKMTIASLGHTPAAKRFLIDSAKALESRKIERADFYVDYQNEKGSLKGVRKSWDTHKKKTPLLATNPNTGLPVFYNQFEQAMMGANRGISRSQVLDIWRNKYAQ